MDRHEKLISTTPYLELSRNYPSLPGIIQKLPLLTWNYPETIPPYLELSRKLSLLTWNYRETTPPHLELSGNFSLSGIIQKLFVLTRKYPEIWNYPEITSYLKLSRNVDLSRNYFLPEIIQKLFLFIWNYPEITSAYLELCKSL